MKTALFVAVDEGQTELVKLLLKSKADVGVKDECAKRSLCEQAGQSSLAKG
jgi:ankyrin repeat protein